MKEVSKMTELGEIPNDWDVLKLGDIFRLSSGEGLSKSLSTKGEFPVYGGNGISFYHSKYNQENSQIIIGRVGAYCGCIHRTTPKCWITDNALFIRERLQDYDDGFMYYVLNRLDLNNYANKNAQPVISGQKIYPLQIGFPNKLEQKKIADILSAVDDKIEVIELRISQTQELKKGLMQQFLTKGIGHTKFKNSELGEIPESWEVMNLGSLVDKVGSGITPKGGQETYLKEGILFIRSQNVLHGKLKLSDVAYISKEQNEKMQGSQIATGDVLLNITGASIGRSCVVPDNITEGNVNQHVCIIRTKKQLNNSFLCQLLNSNYGQNQIDKFQAGGNREGLNFQQIRSFDIPFPPLKEQNKIADILSTMDEKLEALHAKKENFQELKRGLMQKLLIGKIRVKFN